MKTSLAGLASFCALVGALGSAGCQQQAPVASALVSGERGVTSIAVDDGFVYWTRVDGTVKKASLDTGVVETISSEAGLAGNVTLDGDNVYFSRDYTLYATPKVGGRMLAYAQKATINRIALDAENIYWSDTDDQNNINKMAKAGAAAAPLASTTNAFALIAGSSNLLFGSSASSSDLVTTNGDAVAAGSGVVNAVPVAGGTISTLLAESSSVLAMIQDSSRLYVAGSGADGGILVAALDGSNQQVLASDPLTVNLSSDETNLYWSNATGEVQFVPVVGGNVMPLVTGPAGSVSMTTDASTVYWANSADQGIFAMSKQQ